MGAMGSVAVRRKIGGGAVLDKPLAHGVSGVAGERGGDSAEPNPFSLWTTDASRRGEARSSRLIVASGDFWRRSSGVSEPASVAETPSGTAATGEYVRDHGDHGACDLSSGQPWGCRRPGRPQPNWNFHS